eukprot:Hpha_TRINITY_DN20245_c0_g1::TRINITY_DN20245_c0_g1_i1::g.168271::m.168271
MGSALVLRFAHPCSEPLEGWMVANCLYSIRHFAYRPANRIAAALTPLVSLCPTPLSPKEVCLALYGLQGACNLDELLLALAPLVRGCPLVPSGTELGAALFGLREVSRMGPGVRQLLLALTPLIHRAADKGECMEPLSVACAVHGFRNMTVKAETVEALRGVARLVRAGGGMGLTARLTAKALVGLRWMGHSTGVDEVLEAVAGRASFVLRDVGLLECAMAFR